MSSTTTVDINVRKILERLKLITYNEKFHLERLLQQKIHRKLKENNQVQKLGQIHDIFWEVVHSVKYILNPVTIGLCSTMEKNAFRNFNDSHLMILEKNT